MRARWLLGGGVLAIGGALAAGVMAFTPSATRGLTYRDVDADYLDRTLLVVAASRLDTSALQMKGATLFVGGASGEVDRIDNDGLDDVALAFDGERVGFADENHDYLLGTKDPVRDREEVVASAYGSFWVDDTLVTAFNGGFGDEHYDLGVSESGATTSFRYEAGYVEALATCDDGLWVIRNPNFESVGHSASVVIDRLAPGGGRSWTLKTDRGHLGFREAACSGSRLVAVGSTEVGDDSTDLIAEIDVRTGRSTLVPVKGIEPEQNPSDGYYFKAASMTADGFHVVIEPADGVTEGPHELLRIDPATGEATRLAAIEDEAELDMEVRVQGDHLYVLDVNHDTDSRLRAYRLSDGELVGTRTFEPLDAKLSGVLTSYDSQLFVEDFAVTTPVERW